MIIFRFVALLLIVASLMLLGGDLFAMLEASDGGGFLQHTRSLEEIWGMLHPDSLETVTGTPVSMALGLPASLTLGGVGLVLAFLFRSRD